VASKLHATAVKLFISLHPAQSLVLERVFPPAIRQTEYKKNKHGFRKNFMGG
jgi:hypothetical protein